MFADPFSTLMAMFFLCFIGMLIMFLFVIRSLSEVSTCLREVVRKQTAGFVEIEQHLMEISFAKRGATSQKDKPLATTSDAPNIMTDSDLSSLLTSISDSRMGASESLLPFNSHYETEVKKVDSSLDGIFDTSSDLDLRNGKSNNSLYDENLLHIESKYK